MDSKELIRSFIRKMFITARIGIESDEFDEETINQFIGTEAQECHKEVMKMDNESFMMYCVKELLDELMMIKKEGGSDDKDSI